MFAPACPTDFQPPPGLAVPAVQDSYFTTPTSQVYSFSDTTWSMRAAAATADELAGARSALADVLRGQRPLVDAGGRYAGVSKRISPSSKLFSDFSPQPCLNSSSWSTSDTLPPGASRSTSPHDDELTSSGSSEAGQVEAWSRSGRRSSWQPASPTTSLFDNLCLEPSGKTSVTKKQPCARDVPLPFLPKQNSVIEDEAGPELVAFWYSDNSQDTSIDGDNVQHFKFAAGVNVRLVSHLDICADRQRDVEANIKYVAEPVLPDGLCLDARTGIITGVTPKEAGQLMMHKIIALVPGKTTGGIPLGALPLTSCTIAMHTVDALPLEHGMHTVDTFSLEPSKNVLEQPVLSKETAIVDEAGPMHIAFWYGKKPADGEKVQRFTFLAGVSLRIVPNLDLAADCRREVEANLSFIVDPALPDGLCLDERTGIISGVPANGPGQFAIHKITALVPARSADGVFMGAMPLTSCSISMQITNFAQFMKLKLN